MEAQLGFDWTSLIGIGANIGSNINSAIQGSSVTPIYGVTGATGGSSFQNLTQSPMFWPIVIAGGAVIVLMMNKK